MHMGNALLVGGNLQNSGTLFLTGVGPMRLFSVAGTLVNTGSLQWGSGDGVDPGTPTSLGGIVNTGSVFIGPGTNFLTAPSGVTDIPKGASWEIGGQFNGFSHLTGIEGALNIEGTLDTQQINVSPLTLGSPGNTVHNSSSFTIGSGFGTSVVNVIGNLSNASDIEVAASGPPPMRQFGPSTLNVAGTITNQANGTLNVNNPDIPYPTSDIPSPGALNVENLLNYGTANFQAGTASTAQFLQNNGTLNIFGDAAADIGSLTVGTLKPAAGVMTVFDHGGLLVVGSGPAPAGFIGYYQLANGVLDAAGGELDVRDPVDLNGTLDIMLGDGYKPVGTVFTVLYGYGQPLTGAFSNVEGLVFDGGREKYVLSYEQDIGSGVFLTVENNTTPEPGSVFLVLLGFAGIFGIRAARKASHRLSPLSH